MLCAVDIPAIIERTTMALLGGFQNNYVWFGRRLLMEFNSRDFIDTDFIDCCSL